MKHSLCAAVVLGACLAVRGGDRPRVVVVGGSSAGVSAAVAAAEAGAEVTLVTPRIYLGEDIAGGLRTTFDPSDDPSWRYSVPLWGNGTATPFHAKAVFDEACQKAGVTRRLGAVVRDVLKNAQGRIVAVEVADRSGTSRIAADTLVDATAFGRTAARAGATFTAFVPGERTLLRRVISADVPKADGLEVVQAEGIYPFPLRYIKAGFWGDTFKGFQDENLKFGEFVAKTYDCAAKVRLDDLSPASVAAADGRLREATYTRMQVDGSEFLGFVRPYRLVSAGRGETFRAKGCPQVFVASPLADVADDEAERLALPGRGGRAAFAVGAAAAKEASEKGGAAVCAASRPLAEIASCDVLVVGGGTAGAPAAIAAARDGAKTILVEAIDTLGGTMTEGRIGNYWYGNLCGFTTEVDVGVRALGSVYPEAKSEWFRREAAKAGAQVWFGSPAFGVVREGGKVVGVEVLAPNGEVGVVRCKVAIDATGNALLAAFAGARTVFVDEGEVSLQAAGWAPQQLGVGYNNTHLTYLDTTSAADVQRTAEASRRGLAGADVWNQSQISGARERRRIVGEITVGPLDILCGRTYPDTITRAYSDFDTHGQCTHPLFRVLGLRQNEAGEYADLPYRALVPEKVDGLLVLGLGISAHRDAMPILRMQPDLQNHGYAAGLAAAAAVRDGVEVRSIDVRALQRKLVKVGILKPEVLKQVDSFPLPEARLAAAAKAVATDWKAMAPLMTDAARSIPLVRAEHAAATGERRLRLAIALGILGDAAGEADVVAALETETFAAGWGFNAPLAADGYKGGPGDRLLFALGGMRSTAAIPAMVAAAGRIRAHGFYSHFRSFAIASEQIGDRRLLPALASLLGAEGVRGHAQREMRPLAYGHDSKEADRTMGDTLREMALAQAVWTISGGDETLPGVKEARASLEAFAHDARTVFATHARRLLRRE